MFHRSTLHRLDKVMRIPAFEGARLAVERMAALLRAPVGDIDDAPRSHLALTRPAIGCFLSHLALWRWVVQRNVARVLILEDDAAPTLHFDPARFRSVLAGIPEQTGMVFLGRIIMNGMADKPDSTGLRGSTTSTALLRTWLHPQLAGL